MWHSQHSVNVSYCHHGRGWDIFRKLAGFLVAEAFAVRGGWMEMGPGNGRHLMPREEFRLTQRTRVVIEEF